GEGPALRGDGDIRPSLAGDVGLADAEARGAHGAVLVAAADTHGLQRGGGGNEHRAGVLRGGGGRRAAIQRVVDGRGRRGGGDRHLLRRAIQAALRRDDRCRDLIDDAVFRGD